MAVNRELLVLYWSIGRDIANSQEREAWGSAVIDRLGKDLQSALPGLQGFSPRNLWRMRAFSLAYRSEPTENNEDEFLPQAVAEIPWGHHALLLDKVKDPEERLFYARSALANGWSRSILTVQIEALAATKQPKHYEQAVKLLSDLRAWGSAARPVISHYDWNNSAKLMPRSPPSSNASGWPACERPALA